MLSSNSYISKRVPGVANKSIEAVLALSGEGATVPFMARYRKERTGNLDEVQIRAVLESFEDYNAILQRREFVVKEIEKQGVAYAAGGSVYFSVAAFKAKGHAYAKCAPWQVGNESAAAEGEGELSAPSETEKKSGDDFALWKKSKPGEPAWPTAGSARGATPCNPRARSRAPRAAG